jgi:hypothetical protein
MRRPHLLVLAMLALMLVGCKKKQPKVPEPIEVFSQIVLPPGSAMISQSGSEDALALLILAPGTVQQAADYYRRMLAPPTWRLVSDATEKNAQVLYAQEQGGRPLWVRIWPDSTNNGTFIQLTGAVQKLNDTTAAPEPAATFKPVAPPPGFMPRK